MKRRIGATNFHKVENVALHDLEGAAPHVTFDQHGESRRLDWDTIVVCDGFHGVSRQAIPVDLRREFERIHPLG